MRLQIAADHLKCGAYVGARARIIIVLAFVVSVAHSAGAQTVGDVDVQFGFTFQERSPDQSSFPRSRRVPVQANVYLGPDVTLHVSTDSVLAVDTADKGRQTVVGDTKAGAAWSTKKRGGLKGSFDYTVKAPTADNSNELGSGYWDHVLTGSASFDLGETNNISADLGDYIAGSADGRSHYLFTAGYFSHQFDIDGHRELDFEVDFTPSAHGNPSDAVASMSALIFLHKAEGSRSQSWTLNPGISKGLVDSSSNWGVFVALVYSNSKPTQTKLLFARRAVHIIGTGGGE